MLRTQKETKDNDRQKENEEVDKKHLGRMYHLIFRPYHGHGKALFVRGYQAPQTKVKKSVKKFIIKIESNNFETGFLIDFVPNSFDN